MRSKYIAVLKYILILGVGIGLLVLALKGNSLGEIIEVILTAKIHWLLLSVLASLIAFYSRALRWKQLIEPLGYKVSNANTFASLMVGYLANLAVPRMGEVSRCGALSKVEATSFSSLLGTVIIERIIDVVCLLICILLVTLVEYERLGNFLNEQVYIPLTSKFNIVAGNPIIVMVIALILIGAIFLLIRTHKKNVGKSDKFTTLVKGIIDGVDTIRKMKSPFVFLLHTILIWSMYFLMSYICFRALDSTAHLDWHAGLFVLVAGGLGMSAPIPGGAGSYHFLVKMGLVLYGISEINGKAFAILMHGSQTLVVIIIGGISYLFLVKQKKNGSDNVGNNPQ
jgi:uncharacterized protein (TIRG00374 family)